MKHKLFFSLALIATIIGCGKADENTNTSGAPSVGVNNPGLAYPGYLCPTGQYGLLGGCMAAASWDQACYIKGGTLISSGGRQLCKIVQPIGQNSNLVSLGGTIPRITPSQRSGGYYVSVVRQGEQVIFSGTARWKKLGSFSFSFGSNPCGSDTTNQDGVKNGNTEMNEGLPQGFVGTDGTNVFLLGSNSKTTFQSDGQFRWGFNSGSDVSNACYTVTANDFRLSHCSDSAGTIYPCL